MKTLEERIKNKIRNYEFSMQAKQNYSENEISERILRLSQGKKIKTQELNPIRYLKRLSQDEQNNLIHTIKIMKREDFQRFHGFYPAILAVGTTTHSNREWNKLKQYLKKDKSKKYIIDNKGEDIDIRLVPETGRALQEITINRIKTLFDRQEINYTYSETCEWSASYLEVPEKFQEQQGEKIIRFKGENFNMPNFKIKFSTGRDIHLYIGANRGYYNAVDQIYYERATNEPFSILARYLDYEQLENNIQKANTNPFKLFLEDAYINTQLQIYKIKKVLKKNTVETKKEIDWINNPPF